MEYKTYPPSVNLESFVKCFWTLRVPKQVSTEKQQILPDGCLEMFFTLADDIKRYTEGDQFIIQPRSFILGQISKPFFIQPLGEVDTFAIRFYPAGLSHFTQVPIKKLTNHETPLESLFDEDRVTQLRKHIIAAESTEDRIMLVEEFLFSTLVARADVNQLVESTVETILTTNGMLGIGDMLGEHQNKRRQLERRFSTMVGLSPKHLCRVIRLQSALRMMLDDKAKDLTRIGNEHEYFDQAHFIKDFKDFTGVSPKEFYREEKFSLSSIIYGAD